LSLFGPAGFWIYLGGMMVAVAAYTAYRMTRRPVPTSETSGESVSYVPLTPTSSLVAAEVAQELYIDNAEEQESAGTG
jgi:hypothetical protein